MNSEAIIAIVSVCVTGLVSVLGILLPAYLEWRRSQWQRISARIERIYEKAENLSSSLAEFRNPAYLKETGRDVEARIKLRANHDAWEMALFSELRKDERERVRHMRKCQYGFKYLTGKDETGEANVMKLIDNVVEMSCSAIERLNKPGARCMPR